MFAKVSLAQTRFKNGSINLYQEADHQHDAHVWGRWYEMIRIELALEFWVDGLNNPWFEDEYP